MNRFSVSFAASCKYLPCVTLCFPRPRMSESMEAVQRDEGMHVWPLSSELPEQMVAPYLEHFFFRLFSTLYLTRLHQWKGISVITSVTRYDRLLQVFGDIVGVGETDIVLPISWLVNTDHRFGTTVKCGPRVTSPRRSHPRLQSSERYLWFIHPLVVLIFILFVGVYYKVYIGIWLMNGDGKMKITDNILEKPYNFFDYTDLFQLMYFGSLQVDETHDTKPGVFHSDGLHLSVVGAARIGRLLSEAVRRPC